MPSLTGGQTDELNRLARECCPVCGRPLDPRANSPVMYGVGQGPPAQLPGSWQVEIRCPVHGLVSAGELAGSDELPWESASIGRRSAAPPQRPGASAQAVTTFLRRAVRVRDRGRRRRLGGRPVGRDRWQRNLKSRRLT
ncbi:MAG: hypothetical protein M0Z47_04135 [Actinomycetota bacterium]|nr:hypothetical protein [Actinomycetota bacterium]